MVTFLVSVHCDETTKITGSGSRITLNDCHIYGLSVEQLRRLSEVALSAATDLELKRAEDDVEWARRL